MSKILSFFRSLRGKLILTYTIVTVLALLALEVTILLVVFGFSGGLFTNTGGYLSDVVHVLPPQARVYLQPGAKDLKGLQSWLQATYEAGYASLPAQNLLDNPAAPIVRSEPIYVLSPDGNILAAAPADAADRIGKKYVPPAAVTGSRAILDRAYQINLQPTQISALTSAGNYLMAVPVRQEVGQGPLVAVIIVTVRPPSARMAGWWVLGGGIVIFTAFVLLIAVAPFGALFGFIMSGSLTRRLRTLTSAVDAWSEGDFSVRPQDRSKDEISYLGERMRRMADHIQTLLQTQQELALLEERNRLARELHDTVKQESFATLMQVRAAKNLLERDAASARAHLDEAEALINSSQEELGQLISELRPAALVRKGFTAVLEDYLAAWSQRSCIPTDLQVENERRLAIEIEQALFRVAQEALSNIARHSRASAATVSITCTAVQVSLCVTDNGVGFDAAAGGDGFGLKSMRDRMEAIHGTLSVQAAPDHGTTVLAVAPIKKEK